MRGHVIYFRRCGGPRPISRKWHFRGPTFPESNNTESSFNKGSATIYRGHASHSHLSASTAYIATPLPRVPSSILPQPPATPFIPGDRMSVYTPGRLFFPSFPFFSLHPVSLTLFLSVFVYTYWSSIREFFSQFLSSARARGRDQIAAAFALRERYVSADPFHYFNERDAIDRVSCFGPRTCHSTPP